MTRGDFTNPCGEMTQLEFVPPDFCATSDTWVDYPKTSTAQKIDLSYFFSTTPTNGTRLANIRKHTGINRSRPNGVNKLIPLLPTRFSLPLSAFFIYLIIYFTQVTCSKCSEIPLEGCLLAPVKPQGWVYAALEMGSSNITGAHWITKFIYLRSHRQTNYVKIKCHFIKTYFSANQ